MSDQTKFILNESDLPRFWYNINADSPVAPTPVLRPDTLEPVTPDFLSVLFPMDLILQEVSTERFIPIPEEVREIYKLYRPTPLIRARRLEKMLDTTAHIYYKNEGVSPAGSHKPNTAIPQAFFNKAAGTKALATETGAGQWGSALALACNFFGLDLEVYMVKVSYQQKPYRRLMMETYGAQVFASPTELRAVGAGPGPRQPRVSRYRHLGGGRGGRDVRRKEEIQPGLGAESRAPAPERHWGRGAEADGDGQRVSGRGHRLRGRRLELRWHSLSVPA
jgi:predicted alternative tryptophan synthase beta-subunit